MARRVGGPGGVVRQPRSAVTGPVVTFRAWLGSVDAAGLSDAERVDLVAELERVKGASSAVQARATDALRCSREVVAPADVARSVGSQVALARRESPGLGDRFVGLSRALVHEMPATMRALTGGVIGERHAVAVVAATAALSRGDRAEVDRSTRSGAGPARRDGRGAGGGAGRGRAGRGLGGGPDGGGGPLAQGHRAARLPTGWPTCRCSLRCARASGPTPRCGPGPPRWWAASAPTRRPRAAASGR